MKYFFSLSILIILLSSCHENERKQISPLDFFESTVNISSSPTFISSDSLAYVLQLVSVDSFLVIKDKFDKKIYHLIDLKNKQYIRRFGRLGKGPGEFSTHAVHTNIKRDNPRMLSAFDTHSGWYSEFQIDSIVLNRDPQPITRSGPLSINFRTLNRLNDTLFYGVGHFESRYAITDLNRKIVKEIYDYPFSEELDKKISFGSISMANQGDIRVRPNGKEIVLTYHKSGNLEICKVGDEIEKIKDIYTSPVRFTDSGSGNTISADYAKDNVVGYPDVAVTNAYIYALYSGRTIEEYGYRNLDIGNTVLVFDWEGNAIKKLKLDREISALTVNKDDSWMYASTLNEHFEPEIIQFQLNLPKDN